MQVVQVMFEDASGAPATTLFCETWRGTFSLTMPLFVDPVGRTIAWFDTQFAPYNLILNRDGEILVAETGTILTEDFETTLRGIVDTAQ